MENQNEILSFKPSLKPEYLKLAFSIIVALAITILASNGVFNPDLFNINLNSLNIDFLKNINYNFNILSLVYVLTCIYIFIKIFNMVYIKLYYTYIIDKNKVIVVEGILFKNERTFPIKNIKNVDILAPSLFQLIINVRTLRLEVDGMEGYDDYFLNIVDYNEIKNKIYSNFEKY